MASESVPLRWWIFSLFVWNIFSLILFTAQGYLSSKWYIDDHGQGYEMQCADFAEVLAKSFTRVSCGLNLSAFYVIGVMKLGEHTKKKNSVVFVMISALVTLLILQYEPTKPGGAKIQLQSANVSIAIIHAKQERGRWQSLKNHLDVDGLRTIEPVRIEDSFESLWRTNRELWCIYQHEELPLLVLEDDVRFHPNTNVQQVLQKAIESLKPNVVDYVNLGGFLIIASKERDEHLMYDPTVTSGTEAMLYSPQAMGRLCNLKTMPDMHFDLFLQILKLRKAVTYPQLSYQSTSPSTISSQLQYSDTNYWREWIINQVINFIISIFSPRISQTILGKISLLPIHLCPNSDFEAFTQHYNQRKFNVFKT